jgi:hypothetical protein
MALGLEGRTEGGIRHCAILEALNVGTGKSRAGQTTQGFAPVLEIIKFCSFYFCPDDCL